MTKTKPKKVWVHWDKHRKRWSLRINGRVADKPTDLHLKNCTFRVWQSGRERAIREGKRNVHAFVVGVIATPEERCSADQAVAVMYNPWDTLGAFTTVEDKRPIISATHVSLITEIRNGRRSPTVLATGLKFATDKQILISKPIDQQCQTKSKKRK